jgi:hypothetical protein
MRTWVGIVALSSIVLLAGTKPVMAWTIEGDVTDSKGKAISGGLVAPDVTVDKVGYGYGVSAASRGKSHYVRAGIRDSDHGCTVRMIVDQSCFRGGTVRLDRCGGPEREHLTMNWTMYVDRAPKVTIISDHGKRTTSAVHEISVPEIPLRPILFTGSLSCRVRGSQYKYRPVSGVRIKILDGYDDWRVLKEATSDSAGRYEMLLEPKCPTNPQLRMIIDPQGTGYHGGQSVAWNGMSWILFTLYPPFGSGHAGGPAGADFSGGAEPLNPGEAQLPQGVSCDVPPPEGARGLPLCDDGCL